MQRLSLLGLAALALTACAPAATTTTNLTPAALEVEPSVKVEVALDTVMKDRQTFTVTPLSQLSDEAQATGITAQHITFQARNYMELLGYRFVESRSEADLEVLVDASSKYSEIYIPPSQYSVPRYVPGNTATASSRSTGTYAGSGGWGSYTGNTTATVTTPGYYTTQTYTTAGYTKGFYYPAITAYIFDTKTNKLQANAVGVGTAKNPDVRVAGQIIFSRIFFQLPPASNPAILPKSGRMGVGFVAYTMDGNTYFPMLTQIDEGLPAARAGLMVSDIILSIDGTNTANKPVSEIEKLITGEAGQERTFVIFRAGQTKTVKLIMAARN